MNQAILNKQIISSLALLLLLFFGVNCTGQGTGQTQSDASAIKVQKPPNDEKTALTASNCDRITTKGKCEEGVAITCNVTRNELVKRDCAALDKDCIWDVTRGASCATIEKKEDLDKDTACPGDKMDAKGVCLDGVAIYCDTKKDTITVWKCKSTQTCEMAKCREGANCCDKNPDETPTETTEECGDYTFEGKCVGNVAKWCGSDDTLKVDDCSDWDQRCIEDVCATGAYCCDENADKECSEVGGAEGICSPDKTKMIYCDGDSSEDIITENCEDYDMECQIDGPCGSGAQCCEKATGDNKCLEVGSKGKCDGDTLIFCLGTEEADIKEADCTLDGMKCEVNTCKPGEAACCNPDGDCATLGTVGECNGDILRYCTLQDVVKEIDCTTRLDDYGKAMKCEHDTCLKGYYGCCPQ